MKKGEPRNNRHCPYCGYPKATLHDTKGCPLCAQCPRCKHTVKECRCIEGE
ncbi:hypothetical protein HY490_03585 [Candidatus Woesearchaeota archaeon]|nr:hypothetical protein [Candidatus Woesearchaeota archaeon]